MINPPRFDVENRWLAESTVPSWKGNSHKIVHELFHNLGVAEKRTIIGAKGRVSDGDRTFDRAFWAAATPEEKVRAIFELRELYEVMHPGVGSQRLDRSVGGTRRIRD